MAEENEREDNDEENKIEFTKEIKDKLDNRQGYVCTMIEALSFFKQEEMEGKKEIDNDIIKETKEYLINFNKYGLSQNDGPDRAQHIFKIFGTEEKSIFTNLEKALIIDLAPANTEEAFTLIPSLKKNIKEEDLREYLDNLNKEILNK